MRSDRFSGRGPEDQRNPFERDHDRILYSSYFHRLAGITQIVRAGEEDTFHTRQQHTHKVAQIGRRLSQKLIREAQSRGNDGLEIDPEVVAAASLAHDLGHPPFGHMGETTLNTLLKENREEGYEGNAQTFRIITKLAVRFDHCDGLDLTRAVCCAILKYPWLKDTKNPDKTEKWSAYQSEQEVFEWAREGQVDDTQCMEAHLMDWADDIAYSVHDLEDFHRCNLIPWVKILNDSDERARIIERTAEKWHNKPANASDALASAFSDLLPQIELFKDVLEERYDGSYAVRLGLRQMTSALVGNFINQTTIDENGAIYIPDETRHSVFLLKQMTRDYVISNPALAAQQKGQGRILSDLYDMISHDTKWGGKSAESTPKYLPRRLEYLSGVSDTLPRFVADCIASLTEREATQLHSRLVGYESGSVLDPIVR